MPVSVLNATAGSATANAYVTLAVANQYHLDRPAVKTTWANASDDAKTAAILWATKLLDRYFDWYGAITTETQKLLWPRAGLVDINDWNALDINAVPELIQFATAEYARQLLVSDRTGDSDIETLGITQIKTTSVRIDFKEYGIYAKPVPDIVADLIPSQWGRLKSRGQMELERA